MMARLTIAVALTAVLLHVTPTLAATPQEKLDTCNFGADEKKLTGAARKSFLAKCMSDTDSPRGKPAAKPKSKQQP